MSRDDLSKMDRRSYLKLAGGAASAVSLAGCTGNGGGSTTTTATDTATDTQTETQQATTKQGSSSGTFEVTVTQGQLDTGLDPQDNRDTPTDNIVRQAYEKVLGRDRKGKVIANLATKWEMVAPDQARFTIREGVKFHNGDTLTPGDVAYSINRIVKDDVGFASPQASQLDGVTGAKVVDGKHAVDVMSDGVNPIVFSEIATYGQIVQKSWIESHSKAEINKSMNGTGPFKLETYKQDVKVVFTRNEDYWREPATASKVTFNAAKESSTRVDQLVTGSTDVTVNVPPQDVTRVKKSDKADVAAVPSTRLLFSAMRYDVAPFSSKKFRQAINYAIDLESIVKNVLSGFGAETSQPTLEGFVGYNSDVDPYPFDKAKAEQLVKESGHAGAKIELHTPVGRYLKDVSIAQAVAGYVDDLSNVSCSVKQVDFGTLAGQVTTGKLKDKPHFYLLGWGEATFDGGLVISSLLTSDAALSSFGNDTTDKLVKDAQHQADAKKRDKTLQQANADLHDLSPWVYLNRQYSVYGVSKRLDWKPRRDERIEAYAFEPAGNQ